MVENCCIFFVTQGKKKGIPKGMPFFLNFICPAHGGDRADV